MSGLASKKSPFLMREIFLVATLTSGIFYLDSVNSNYFWKTNSQIVRDITNYSDLMVVDEKRLAQMRDNYAKGSKMVTTPTP